MDISSLTINNLEQLIESYPWFTIARREYISRCADSGEDALQQAVSKAGIHVLSRRYFEKSISKTIAANKEAATKVAQEAETVKVESAPQNTVQSRTNPAELKAQHYYIVGGDYFGQEDFQQLEKDGLSVSVNLSLNPISHTLGSFGSNIADQRGSAPVENDCRESDDLDFCTETLAKIYVEQEFYARAREVYKKLILLYPEKSTYFASLMEKVKK
ncbi:MAG: hypothetical protein PHD11_00155 [Bacteroidales bacterium]|nr:hypothetical protein [Bacteroidales bacterium]MDD4670580.1 hypothetical protein [Bacteroidales bacterium]